MIGPDGYHPVWDDVVQRGTGRPHYYNRATEPISLRQWVQLFEEHPEYKRVAETTVGNKMLWVSTIWLGLDHGWQDPPLIFETMVFLAPRDDDPVRALTDIEEIHPRRYSYLVQAVEGHRTMVRLAKAWVAANSFTWEKVRELLEADNDQ